FRTLEKLLKKELGSDPSREITEFVRKLPANGPEKPLPKLADGKRISLANLLFLTFPWERKTRVYGVCAALSTIAALAILFFSQPWRRSQAQAPPLSSEQRIAVIESLRITPGQPDTHAPERAKQCIALAEQAWNDPNGWWGRDEDRWHDLLKKVDSDLENS